MVSKNNFKHKMEQTATRTPHYAIRKVGVGVASVLISTTLYMGATTAKADSLPNTTTDVNTTKPITVNTDDTTKSETTADKTVRTTTDSVSSTDNSVEEIDNTSTTTTSAADTTSSILNADKINSSNVTTQDNKSVNQATPTNTTIATQGSTAPSNAETQVNNNVGTVTHTLTEHYVYQDGPDQGQAAKPDSQIQVFFSRNKYLDKEGTVTGNSQWYLDTTKGDTNTPGYRIISGDWKFPEENTGDVLRVNAPEIENYDLSPYQEYHYTSALTWYNPQTAATDYMEDPNFYDVRMNILPTISSNNILLT